ncbi:MAG: hypothetical protein V8R82_09990 [Clostridia bacterium]
MEPKRIGKSTKKIDQEKKRTKEYVAKRIGITNKKLEKKLEGKEEFYISEIIELKKIFNLNIEECAKIFLMKIN